jgi:hypothetical protein
VLLAEIVLAAGHHQVAALRTGGTRWMRLKVSLVESQTCISSPIPLPGTRAICFLHSACRCGMQMKCTCRHTT